MPKQVRLDDDVVDALERLVARQGEGSVASHANRKLRQVLGLNVPAVVGAGGVVGAQRAFARSAAGRGRRGAGRSLGGGSCPHPPDRIVGDACTACGHRF